MVTAYNDSTRSWRSLLKARALALKKSGDSQTLANKLIVEVLAAGTPDVDWRCKRAEDVTSLADFWKHPGLVVNWEDNSAWAPVVIAGDLCRGTLYGVEISAAYLDKAGLIGAEPDALAITAKTESRRKRKEPAAYARYRALADQEYPGWREQKPGTVIDKVARALTARGELVPKRDVFLRAFGFRTK
jgi:hypothetical protein